MRKKGTFMLLSLVLILLCCPVNRVNAQSVFQTENLKATVNSDKSVGLSWSRTADAEGYIIYRRVGDGKFTYLYMTGNSQYTDKSAVINQVNYYRVYPYKTIDGKRSLGTSANYVYGKPQAGTTKNLSVSLDKNSSNVQLKWDKTANVTGYIIYRRVGDGQFKYLTMTNKTTYTDTAVTIGSYHFYRVYPYLKKGDTRYLGTSANYVYTKPSVGEASNVKASANKSRQITVSWDEVANADGYIIYRKKTGENSFSYVGITSSLKWTNSDLQPDVFYYYKVYPYKNVNGKRDFRNTNAYVYAKAASSAKLSGLTKIDGYYYYYLSNGDLRKGFNNWNDIGKAYFDETTGAMYLGKATVKSNGYTYYFKQGGGVETGFKTVDGKKYYFSPNSGAMATGYMTIDNKKYYFDPKTGEMLTGFQTVTLSNGTYTFYFKPEGDVYTGLQLIKGDTYYFSNSGVMQTGYLKVNDTPYDFDTATGKMLTGIQEVTLPSDGRKYKFYFNEGGGVYRGFKTVDGKIYYFNTNQGEMVSDRMMVIDDKKYYFGTDGAAVTGIQHVKDENYKVDAYYYFDPSEESGVKTGLQDYAGSTYYLNTNSGAANTGFWSIGDTLYFFDRSNGKMTKSKTFTYSEAGIVFTADANGKLTWKAADGQKNNKRTQAIMAAFAKLGYPYRTDDTGYVCSSLVAYAYSQVGFTVFNGMESHEQAKYCYDNKYTFDASKNKIDDTIKPGDLVFWSNYDCADKGHCDHWEEIHHVGIYLGHGQMVEASEKQDTMLVHNITQDDKFVIRYYANVLGK